MTALRRLWDVGFVAVGAGIAAALAWPIYESPRVAVIAAAAAAVGIAIVLLTRRAWVAALAAVLAFVVLVVPLAVPAGLGSPERFVRALRDGVLGVVLGWKQLLTLALPLGEYQAVLVPLLVVVLGGTVLALALIVHGGRAAPAAVPVVLAMGVFGLAFGSSAPGAGVTTSVLLVLALVVAALLWLLGRARFARAESLRAAQASTAGLQQARPSFWRSARRRILAASLLVVALVAGLAAGPIAAGLSPRQALRDGVDPRIVLRDQPSPLSAYRSWFAAAYDGELFTVAGATDSVDRLRIATLDSYDGQVFEVGSSDPFQRLPRTDPGSGSTELTVTIGDAFSGPWVPVPAGLTASPVFEGPRADLLADGFFVGQSGATALETAIADDAGYGLRAGDSYRVGAPVVEDAELSASRGGDSLLPTDQYPSLVDWVELQEVPRTGEGLIQLVDLLTQRGYLSHALTDDAAAAGWIADLSARAPYVFQSSYAGHSTARVEQLFGDLVDQQLRAGQSTDPALLVSAVGDDEQFATAAALLARYFGFDSRVVVGVRLAADHASPIAPCADGVCTGANVTAWAEARTPEGQWAVLDASPQFAVAPTSIAVGEQLPENPTVPDQASADVVDPPAVQRDDTAGADAPVPPQPGWLDVLLPVLSRVGMGLLGVLLILLAPFVLLAAKALRRRSRRDAEVAEVSIVGAWDELVDTYVDHGVDLPAATRGEFARGVGRPGVLELAATVDHAVFAQTPSGVAASERAWQLVDGERLALRRASTRMERVRAALSPASFIRPLRRPEGNS